MDRYVAPGLFGRGKSYILIVIVLFAALVDGTLAYNKRSGSHSKLAEVDGEKGKKKKRKEGSREADSSSGLSKVFQGGMFEASGVAYVPGTDGVLFIDDNRADEILWMRLDQAGNQLGDIKPVKLGLSIDDPEGITYRL